MMIDFENAPGARRDRLTSATPKAELPAYLARLNDKQLEAALNVDGPLVVLAGAGSGKTSMLTARIAYLVGHCGVPPYNVLAVTFTNKAAGEMKERVNRALADSARAGAVGLQISPEIGTFHWACLRILRREAERLPFTKPFVIYDDSDQLSLIKQVLSKLDIDPKSFSPKSFQAAINKAKCEAKQPHEMQASQFSPFERLLIKVYEQYEKSLVASNALDFGEIICLTYRLLRDHEDVRARYHKRFRYVLVDEYQDTNRAQYLLLSMLASRSAGGHGNICVVGDEDQSIYKWRGADIRNILDFESDYPGAGVVKLEQNYRSTKTIITAASRVISNNSQRKEKTLWTANEDGVPLRLFRVPDERAEAEVALSEIKRLARDEGHAFNEFAVFYRTHAQSRQFEDVLRREKIPYQIVGGLRFYDRKEIKDILAYFRVIMNPSDSVSLRRIVNEPGRGIGKSTIERLDEMVNHPVSEEGAPADLWSALARATAGESDLSPRVAKKLREFANLIVSLTEAQPTLALSELYHRLLDATGYVTELRKEGTVEAEARIENLESLDSLIHEFEEDAVSAAGAPEGDVPSELKPELLTRFLEQVTLVNEVENKGDPSSVKLMTLHASKGLEFPVVFLAGLEEGLFPSVKAWEETPEEDIEEERRLCYVGMTRAERRLYLLTAAERRIWGQMKYQEPSRFLSEIPGALVEIVDLIERAPRPTTGYRQEHRGADVVPIRRPMAVPARPQPAPSRTYDYGSGDSGSSGLVGLRMSHPEYGGGVVIACDGSGDDAKVTVEFTGRVRRKFVMRYVRGHLEGR